MDGDSDSSADLFGGAVSGSGVSGPSDSLDVSDGRPLPLVAMAPRPAPRLVDPVDGPCSTVSLQHRTVYSPPPMESDSVMPATDLRQNP